MSVDLPPFLDQLRGAPTFEAVAEVLRLAVLAEATKAARADEDCEVLRFAVYLRGAQGYRGLASGLSAVGDAALTLPSRTAWSWMQRRGLPFVLHTREGRVDAADGSDSFPASSRPVGERTIQIFGLGDSTHVYGLPVRRGPGVEAVATLEFACLPAAGEALRCWRRLGPQLGLLVDLAAPYLLARPFAPVEGLVSDRLLPVVGESMRATVHLLARFAPSNLCILLTGPTGVGKSTLARWTHGRSLRAAGPFESVQLQQYTPDLRLAHLFGWERNAFTGAREPFEGLLARANGGTLFLDEVGELPLEAQGQLLEFLDTRQYRRLGSSETRTADVRLLCATNRDLEAALAQGLLREDFYGRIEGVEIQVPALDQRRDEIGSWALHFLREAGQELGDAREPVLSPPALLLLKMQDWPRNLRALKNTMARARVFADGAAAGGPGASLCVDEPHVRQALRGQKAGAEARLVTELRAAARTWVDGLDALGEAAPGPLSWDAATKIFRSYVVGEAASRHRIKTAMLRLGEEARVKSGNYNKEEHSARQLVEEFEAALRDLLEPRPSGEDFVR